MNDNNLSIILIIHVFSSFIKIFYVFFPVHNVNIFKKSLVFFCFFVTFLRYCFIAVKYHLGHFNHDFHNFFVYF